MSERNKVRKQMTDTEFFVGLLLRAIAVAVMLGLYALFTGVA